MKKVAIVRRNGLGDLLCTLPLIHYLQNGQRDITLFIDERNAPLVPYLPPLGKVVVLPIRGNKYFNHLKVALSHRSHRFDLALSAKTSPMKLVNIFLFALGAKMRVAYVDSDWHSRLINAPIPFRLEESKRKHQALKALQMINPDLREVPKELYPKVTIPQKIRQKHVDLIARGGPPILLLSASTTRPSSRFDETRYSAIVNQLYNECGPFNVLILSQLKDQFRAQALSSQLTAPHYLHFPRNFEEFMVLMEASDLFFVGDGGIGHISAALEKRAVILFGETNPVEWAPLGGDVSTFYDPIHVNRLEDEKLFVALRSKLQEVISGRENC